MAGVLGGSGFLDGRNLGSAAEAAGTEPTYLISVVAELTGLHPQTLRQYDRLGLVQPGRASGRGRRYSAIDVARLRRVVELTSEGVNLEGVRRILTLEAEVGALRERAAQLEELLQGQGQVQGRSRAPFGAGTGMQPYADGGRNLPVPVTPGTTALVLWRRGS